MKTRASIAGHPLHPMLVVVPLGALPTALVLDVFDRLWPDEGWRLGALVATLFGLAGIFVAIAPGAWDYAKSVPRAGAVWARASRHMLLGLALATLFTLVALLRVARAANGASAGDAPLAWSATALHALGIVGMGVQAWWGAELVMRDEVGVEGAD